MHARRLALTMEISGRCGIVVMLAAYGILQERSFRACLCLEDPRSVLVCMQGADYDTAL